MNYHDVITKAWFRDSKKKNYRRSIYSTVLEYVHTVQNWDVQYELSTGRTSTQESLIVVIAFFIIVFTLPATAVISNEVEKEERIFERPVQNRERCLAF